MIDAETFILTLELDETSFSWLNALREAHFPRERNLLPAHLTLFHKLSAAQSQRISPAVARRVSLPLKISGIRFLGGGVAIDVESGQLQALRAELLQAMGGEFSRQDQQPFRPHVTVQNKVPSHQAKALMGTLSKTFVVRQGTGTGLLLWRYDGGPWTLRQRIEFAG